MKVMEGKLYGDKWIFTQDDDPDLFEYGFMQVWCDSCLGNVSGREGLNECFYSVVGLPLFAWICLMFLASTGPLTKNMGPSIHT